MSSLNEVVKILEEVEQIIRNSEIREEDRELVEQILMKNMNIEAELYAKYLSGNSKMKIL